MPVVSNPCTGGPIAGSLAGDRVIVRWAGRARPVRVRIEGSRDSADQNAVKSAFLEWEASGVPLHFVFVGRTKRADVVVRWIDHFAARYNGWTKVKWDRRGWIKGAYVQLAEHQPSGQPLTRGERDALATHEIGHVMGLAHAADSTAIMWPVLHPGVITAVDAEAARQLYAHRPGVIVSNSRSREDVSDTRELGVSGDNPRGCTR